jgi:hypothetical protein
MNQAWIVAAMALSPLRSLHAQHPRDEKGGSYPFGYEYSPWQISRWNNLEYRTKCEGEPIRGMNTGPMHWSVEFHNRGTDPVSFDYAIFPPGKGKPSAGKGRAKLKARQTVAKLATLPTTRCDDGISIMLENVRMGSDTLRN